MHCLANICYVCLEKDKSLSNINSPLSVNKDIIHIIGYLPFNLGWLKTLQIILICEECCLRLRENYQFMEKCLKNSELLKSYMNNLNTISISNTGNVAELVKLNIRHNDIKKVKCGIQSEDEVLHTIQCQPNIEEIGDVFVDFTDSQVKEGIICKKEVDDKSDNNSAEIIEETEDVFVNTEDYFVKDENSWKREEVDDAEENPTDNNSTENMDNKSDAEVPLNDNAHLTNTDDVSSGFTCKQAHATNNNDLNTVKSTLNIHTPMQTDEKSYECSICNIRFSTKGGAVIHMRIHTGEKPYKCSECKKSFAQQSNLISHIRVHTGDKPYSCSECKKCFTQKSNLVTHMRIHTGEKPYSCSRCKKCFTVKISLVRHMLTHTGEKPYSCSKCTWCFATESNLVQHMLIHTGEKLYECSICKNCFIQKSALVRHMRVHIDKKSQE